MRNLALLLAGGAGVRLGSAIPKQYIRVGGRPIISYALERLLLHEGIDAVQIVADPIWQGQIAEMLSQFDHGKKFKGFSTPGENRQLSVFHGLTDIKAYAGAMDGILIHDAARPLLTGRQITSCLDALAGHEGVLPALPMKDTVYASRDGRTVSSLLKRREIFAGQAPELFRFEKYYEANLRLLPHRILQIDGSTEPAVMAGMEIVIIPGDEDNFKITTKADLERFQRIISGGSEVNDERVGVTWRQ